MYTVWNGADAYSDHYLIAATIKLKLKKSFPQGHWQKKLDIAKLQYPKKNKDFVLELRNRLSMTEVSSEMEEKPTINSKWNAIKTIYSETAQKVLGFKKKGAKEWISASTWQKIEERKQLKAKMLNSKSQRLLEKTKMSYKNKDREVKRNARRDKRVFVEHLASEAEKAAAYGKLGIVYKITKRLCGKCTNQTTHVMDKNGNICTSESEQAARWVQHFHEVLNLPEPEHLANITTTDDILEINTNPPDSVEVKVAIQTLKSGKACGIDAIYAEMLKVDILTSTRVLTDLFQDIWNSDTSLKTGPKVLLSKSPRKATLRTATTGVESPFYLFQARCSAESFLTGWRRLLTPGLDRSKQASGREEDVWTRSLLCVTS